MDCFRETKMNISFVWPGDLNEALIQAFCVLDMVMLLPLNFYIIWLMFTGTKRSMESDIFSLNLALCDIFIGFNPIWIFIVYNTMYFQLIHLYLFILGFLFTARPLFQTCICVEYYLGVVHPVYFLKFKPLRYRVAFSCVSWLSVFGSCVFCYFYYTIIIYHFAFFIQNLLLMAVVVFCCLSVLKALKNPGPGENTANKSKSNTQKQKAFKMMCLIMITMIINFSFTVAPVPAQCFMNVLKYMNVLSVCSAVSLGSGIVQPLLYLHRVERLTCLKWV